MPTRRLTNHPLLTQDNWPRRRRWMITMVTWFIINAQAIIIASLIWHVDTELLKETEFALIGAIVMTLGAYVFGATWDDQNKRQWMFGGNRGADFDFAPPDGPLPAAQIVNPPTPPAVAAAETASSQ